MTDPSADLYKQSREGNHISSLFSNLPKVPDDLEKILKSSLTASDLTGTIAGFRPFIILNLRKIGDDAAAVATLSDSHAVLYRLNHGDIYFEISSCRGPQDGNDSYHAIQKFLNAQQEHVVQINKVPLIPSRTPDSEKKNVILMEENYGIAGTSFHGGYKVSVVLYGIEKQILSDNDPIERIFGDAAAMTGIVGKPFIHRFQPQGMTALAADEKGFMAIHSYPELRTMSVDVVQFRDGKTPADNAVSALFRYLNPTKMYNPTRKNA